MARAPTFPPASSRLFGRERCGQTAARRRAHRLFHHGDFLEGSQKGFERLFSHLPESLFPSAQRQFHAYLVALLQKLLRACFPELAVVLPHLEGNPHALDFDLLPFLSNLAFFFVLLVLVFSVVEESADGRAGRRVHLHKIKLRDAGLTEGFLERHHANLFSVGANKTDLPGANPLVDAMRRLGDKPPAKAGTFRNGRDDSRLNDSAKIPSRQRAVNPLLDFRVYASFGRGIVSMR